VQRELERVIADLRVDLDRVELLTAALTAFSRPIPEYEPSFRHMRAVNSAVYELGSNRRD
jgi:hypothetical protein